MTTVSGVESQMLDVDSGLLKPMSTSHLVSPPEYQPLGPHCSSVQWECVGLVNLSQGPPNG